LIPPRIVTPIIALSLTLREQFSSTLIRCALRAQPPFEVPRRHVEDLSFVPDKVVLLNEITVTPGPDLGSDQIMPNYIVDYLIVCRRKEEEALAIVVEVVCANDTVLGITKEQTVFLVMMCYIALNNQVVTLHECIATAIMATDVPLDSISISKHVVHAIAGVLEDILLEHTVLGHRHVEAISGMTHIVSLNDQSLRIEEMNSIAPLMRQ